MRRLLPLATVPVAVVGLGVWSYLTGYLWPIATTIYRPLLQPKPCNEADWVG